MGSIMGKSRMKTFCPHCYRVVPAGRTCPCRKRDAQRKESEPWRQNYSDAEYLANRQKVIERQGGRCKDCGKACAEWDGDKWITQRMGGEVDHEVPLSKGGTNDVQNLSLRCRWCHRKADAKRRAKGGR